jgi:hypothetical protein
MHERRMTDTAPTRTIDLAGNGGAPAGPAGIPAEHDSTSMLDALFAAAAKSTVRPPLVLKIPRLADQGYSVRFQPNISMSQFEAWQRQATQEVGGREVVDQLGFATAILVNTCTAIVLNGEPIRGDDGGALTFRSESLQQRFGAMDAGALVQALYRNDFHIAATSNKITVAAGFGEDIEAADPLAR